MSQGLSNKFLFWADQSNFFKIILTLPSDLCVDLSGGLPVTILKALLPSSLLARFLAHLNLLNLITLIISDEQYKLWSLLHSPFSSLSGPNIYIRILFLNTFSLHTSLNVRDPAYIHSWHSSCQISSPFFFAVVVPNYLSSIKIL